MFNQKHVAVFISGGIAAYKVPILVRLLQKSGAEVRVIMTSAAQKFVTPFVFESLLHEHTYTDMFDDPQNLPVVHIELADWTDIAIFVPATANVIAKLANGIADDLATTTWLAINKSKYVVPAMNTKMLTNPVTQRNLTLLRQDGTAILPTDNGQLAEGYSGQGRMLEPQAIFDYLEFQESIAHATSKIKNKKILITAGGTKERIDPVRYITNDSSGKMGYALAKAAALAGAQVYLISTNASRVVPHGVKAQYVQSALEMQQAVKKIFATVDVVIMAAAVSDYRPEKKWSKKIKKGTANDLTDLKLVKNPDILASLGEEKQHQYLVGFAAETNDLETYANQKLTRKHADMIIANDVSKQELGFNSDFNAVTVLTHSSKPIRLPVAAKSQLATKIIDLIAQHIS
ncbi:bifunctional phosphopantothenoylcysteine decarboxylase/phosphopantothenate--cysteine ligase CoaBC [Agrilactobacillus fermenti]|uniref:bifunctional phosphopantothenoylcysteine decarboxylase/phosphopantothenate--cysteine ligase CoaBC n=1 Tax=Agrilactobacillus fermenti TaxID=2586909 RepID=UPI001E28E6CC|nr:bifunctional phosphopantothenoylcysteine decarboxylase/phosphopantothenate--cysteine ligase CoaBC [Agrilactobacillus fermenti]MCD2256218.1 bifunctional phosphopantothenoylcysteine decarboxylase/phosphopantothenate--cysteine ligase CoaBC [Agrilactobacillus fermenti]